MDPRINTPEEPKPEDYFHLPADELIGAVKKLPHEKALSILIDALQADICKDKSSRALILDAINYEKLFSSPFITQHLSVDDIKKQARTNSKETSQFFANPDLLLLWMNRASALEVSNFIQTWFPTNSSRYKNILILANSEFHQSLPGKALLCFAIINPMPVNENGKKKLLEAIARIKTLDPREPFDRVEKSIHACIQRTENVIAKSDGVYLKLNNLILITSNLSKLNMEGASLNNAQLDYSTITETNFSHASLQHASLTGCKLDESNFYRTNLTDANLTLATFANANLEHANLTNADLSGANLQGASIRHANLTNCKLDFTEFFNRQRLNKIPFIKVELNRLQQMIEGNAHESMLRETILSDLLSLTHLDDIETSKKIALLKIAYHHELFNRHDDLHTYKHTANAITYAYFSLFRPESADVLTYETKEQERLRETYESLEASLKNPAPASIQLATAASQ